MRATKNNMAEVKQSVLVPYSAARMYDLVDAVEQYPEFLPWCSGSELIYRRPDALSAVIHINFRGIQQHFSTVNARRGPHEMDIRLVDGPFKSMDGSWRFTDLGGAGCKVEFQLRWEFASRVLAALAGPVFNHIATTMVDAFVSRAQKLYG
jgi:ribosome-associated toxin RatA of RatAB toxin-antitoxin module